MFSSLILKNWRQFDNVDIAFDEHLTILTGANGAGKTTILNVLGRHFGWIPDVASTPKIAEEGSLRYDTDYRIKDKDSAEFLEEQKKAIKNSYLIGELKYETGLMCRIMVPKTAGVTYQLLLDGQQKQQGIFLSSHRNVFHYQNVNNIPAQAIKRQEAQDGYNQYIVGRYHEQYLPNTGATMQIKRALISWAMYGYGNKAVKPDKTAKELFEGFQKILSLILPPSLGYTRLEIDSPEVILKTSTGDFSIDAVSGGIAALIEIAWQIYMCGKQNEQFTVVFDEPENHLHPELQRSLMPSLLKAFPNVQFIVATHNPFVIGSAEMSKVYVLKYNENKRVESMSLSDVNKAGTANEILRDVLGIPVTFGSWVEEKLNNIIDKYSKGDITEESIQALKAELKTLGMESFIPDSIVRILNTKD